MRILIAEDDFASRKVILKFLSEYGECDVTVDGMEAIDAFMMALEDGDPYDLICLDVMMPIMDGYEATRTIRALPRKDVKNLPIIAMTANALEEDKEAALMNGMNAHIAKPIDVDVLMEVLRQYLK